MNDRVVYTVISGNYDKLSPVSKIKGIDYYIVSDKKVDVPNGWKLLLITNSEYKGHLFNRYYKICPQLIFSKYKQSLYIDGNINIIGNIDELFRVALHNKDISLYDHPERTSIRDEAKVLKSVGYDYYFRFNKQIMKYLSEGLVDNKLYEANIIFRNHNELKLQDMSNIWFKELMNNVSRDQLSFTYSCHKVGVVVHSLGIHDARCSQDYFKYKKHLRRNPAMKYSVRFVNYWAKLFSFDRVGA